MSRELQGSLVALTPRKGFLQAALSRLKGRRRLWFVLEEGRLLYFRSEGDREPLGRIDTRQAAISLAQDNHFVLHSNGREHVLVADDHDSMMQWILAIQARQDKPEPQQETPRPTVQRTHSLPPEKQLDALRRMHSAALNGQSSPQSESSSSSDSDVPDARVRLLRKMNAEAHSSFSGTSVSSDSAVGTSECSASVRLQELESELVCIKCDLAKALNRESAYKSIIEEKILLVNELEERLRSAEDPLWPPREKPEKCRILQNHNRFLNEEVLKLARMLQNEKKSADHNQHAMRQLESEVEQLKRDYVFLMQSSLRINNSDGPETIEVYLYGGNRHKERVVALLEEARRINPTLPVYENLSRGLPHVDSLGFRHAFSDESLTLHYICRQLHLHYSAVGRHQHHQHWKRHLRHNPALEPSKELKGLVRAGVPLHLRSRVWAALCRARVRDLIEAKGPHYYNFLCTRAPDDERVTHHKRQIALDLLRTMPDNIRFADANADGVRKMQEVLQAFCVHNPALGYCQGMNFLVGMSLLFLEPEDAFWCLVGVCERSFTAHYFDGGLVGAQADQEVLKELVGERLPDLARHFARHDIELATVTLNWFLAVFFDCVPFETLLRMWDCFLLEGPKVLFRFSLSVLRMSERALLARTDTVSIMRQLKLAAKLAYDVDHLFQISFEVLKPFTRRQDIAAKQACYYKTLKEQAKKMDMEKLARKDLMLSEMEFLSVNQLVIECAAVYDKDKLWLCHGHQNGAQITKVNCEENIMYRLNIELESRVMCMHALDDDIMVLATLSHFVHSYSTKSRRLLWEIRLNDSVLSLASHEEDGLRQVYAGLADGTVAVIERIEGESPKPEIFYILIGSSPVTCLRLVERKLWCGTANRVVILNARTLDSLDQFSASSSCLDYLSMLVSDERGVWLTIRGSSVLQLWDPHSLTCRLLFDVRDHKYPRSPKGEEGSGRITALLPLGGSVLVGTAEGFLVIYDVVTKLSRSPSTAQLLDKKREERMDSGCYSTPCRTPQLMARRERGPDDESSEEAVKHSPEPPKKLCTCHQVKSAKCRHCLLEASEALRKLFDKYSLNSAKHVNNTTRYQTLQKANRCEDEEVEAGLGRAISADDVTQWVKSQDSDSYDYDDVFVAYTEDSPRAPPRRRRSSNVLDYSWSSDADWKSSSFSSAADVPYAFELNVQEKIKISDKPIKCLLEARCGSETTIISCAGCYGDDEAVLKWTKVGDEELWTNDPIIEVCPYTNAIKPSPYARSRLPRRPPPRATSTLGSGLAKVHNIFLRVHDNTR